MHVTGASPSDGKDKVQEFKFDTVLGADATQEEVFDSMLCSLSDEQPTYGPGSHTPCGSLITHHSNYVYFSCSPCVAQNASAVIFPFVRACHIPRPSLGLNSLQQPTSLD